MQGITGVDHCTSFYKAIDSADVAPLAATHPAIENHDMIDGIEAPVPFLRRGEINLPERCDTFFRLGEELP